MNNNLDFHTIYIDARERGFGESFYQYIIENAEKVYGGFKINVSGSDDFYFKDVNNTTYLDVGDYVYGNTCIELKNEFSNDFSISMQSGHLDLQMDKLYDTEYDYKELLVIGGDYTDFNLKNYSNKLKSKHIGFNWCPTFNDGIRELLNTFKYTNSTYKKQTPFYKTKLNPAFSFIYNVPGVGYTLAERIAVNLQVHTLQDVMELDKNELKKINGIGDATAETILKYIHNGG